jgi:hypothetical protein
MSKRRSIISYDKLTIEQKKQILREFPDGYINHLTSIKTPTGEITYKTITTRGGKRGEDHFTSSLLCGALAFYLNTDFSFRKVARPKLLGFSWLGQ